MPFTFAHPAIVLPLKVIVKRLSLTGLICGSVVPDFEYFLRLNVHSQYSHTLAGLWWFDLPLGIILTFLWHNVARDGFFINSPPFLKKRVDRFVCFNWTRYFSDHRAMVLLSILLGAGSHLLWDSFTHATGYVADRSVFLQRNITYALHIPVYKMLQHGSSLIGTLVLFFSIRKLAESIPLHQVQWNYRSFFIASAVCTAGILFLISNRPIQIGQWVIIVVDALLCATIFSGVVNKYWPVRQSAQPKNPRKA